MIRSPSSESIAPPLTNRGHRVVGAPAQCGASTWLVEVFAHVVLAPIDEIALFVADSDSPDAAMLAGTGAIDEVLSRLLASPS